MDDWPDCPILQVLSTERQFHPQTSEVVGYRLSVSDGQFYTRYCSWLDEELVENGTLNRFCIVKVKECYKKSAILIFKDLEVLQSGSEVKTFIGAPIGVTLDGSVPAWITSSEVSPIASLSPLKKIWIIKALVTKIEIHQESSGRDSKYVFHLVDESGEIRATAFDQKYFDLCEVGKVYRLSTCLLVSTDQSNTLKDHPYNNEYELVFRADTEMVKSEDASATQMEEVVEGWVFKKKVELEQTITKLQSENSQLKAEKDEMANKMAAMQEATDIAVTKKFAELQKGLLKETEQAVINIKQARDAVIAQKQKETDMFIAQKQKEIIGENKYALEKARIMDQVKFNCAKEDIEKAADLAIAEMQGARELEKVEFNLAMAEMQKMMDKCGSIQRVLKCNNCFAVKTRILQCDQGHLICEPCKASLSNQMCRFPRCRSVYNSVPIRNLVAEEVKRIMDS